MKKTIPAEAMLIPDNANKVFSGELFDVYQWPQAMFDGKTKTFEMLVRPDTVQIIGVKDGKIVLVKDEQPGRSPRVHFPGGRADEDDSWLAAAQREMKEETGLTFKNWRLIAAQQPIPKIEWFTPLFLATDVISEEAQELDGGGEKIEAVLWDFEKIRSAVLGGTEPTLSYVLPLMSQVSSLEELFALPEYHGKNIDR